MDGKRLREVTKGWWLELDGMRRVFLGVVGITVVVLILLPILALVDWPPVPWTGFEVSLYNLVIDFAAGVLTVLGLWLAVSEFAKAQVKPDLRLIVGKDINRLGDSAKPLLTEIDALLGWVVYRQTFILSSRISSVGAEEFVSVVGVGLFLENAQPRAAQYVRVVLRIHGASQVVTFASALRTFKYTPRENTGQDEHGHFIFLQFDDDLVVYKGHRVYLGKIYVVWPSGVHPERITLVASLYSLEGEPKEVSVSRPIRWIEE